MVGALDIFLAHKNAPRLVGGRAKSYHIQVEASFSTQLRFRHTTLRKASETPQVGSSDGARRQ